MEHNENPKDKTPLDDMISRGELIPTSGPFDKDIDPLKNLSCEEVSGYLPDFCNGKIGDNELILKKMEKHLKDSVSNKCGCSDKFAELNEKLNK
ncbi:MAG: hypothetical protein AAB688_01555 [Patescibacteria group bacterium]